MGKHDNRISRRHFLELGAAAGTVATSVGWSGAVVGQQMPHPHENSLDFLDRTEYIHNMEVLNVFQPGQARGGKMQMMVQGDRRLIFQGAWRPGSPSLVIDVSNPMQPTIVNDREWYSGDQSEVDRYCQFQLAYNSERRRWILMNGYDGDTGLKGVRFLDATDPTDIQLLSEWSCDQGDPSRAEQEGSGTHRNFYDGGRYVYLDSQPDDSYANFETGRGNGIQILDVSDPSSPRFVSNWAVPGTHQSQGDDYRMWEEWGDGNSFTSLHGGFYVPRKVEDGGRYGYGSWGSFGLLIHDVSDPARPRLVGRWDTEYRPGGAIPFHATDVSKLDRGFVIVSSEPLQPDCFETWHDNFVVDVRDPTRPQWLATLPVPKPPAGAPYTDFCNKRGRFGPHNPPHQKAPGKPDQNFYALCFFNGGLQCYDVTFPGEPRIAAYFIPGQGGTIDDFGSYFRDTDNVFVEWDRRLIWAACNSGLYLLSTPMLGEPILDPMSVAEWSLPNLNRGHG